MIETTGYNYIQENKAKAPTTNEETKLLAEIEDLEDNDKVPERLMEFFDATKDILP